ncbi:PP2C family protein-serine/threonine phosphatase [Hydrogenivirga sp.]
MVREHFKDRETYADRLFCSEDTFAVADGMGLGKGAVAAAQKAVDLVERYRPFTSPQDMEEFFRRANLKVMEEIAKLGDIYTTGTTLSVLSLHEDRYVLGHVGDSRIYLLREGVLTLLTEDQVEIRNGKKQVSVLGMDWKLNTLTREDELRGGELFLLISDGAVEGLRDEEIERVLSPELEESADRLMELCLSKNPQEEMSFVMVLVE